MIRSERRAAVAFLILLAGCAGTSSGTPAPTGDGARRFDVIGRAELATVRGVTALEAVQRLRPRWLRGRGPAVTVDPSTGQPVARRGEDRVRVYVDGVGRDLELLDLVEADYVSTMRFLSGSDATTRFGIGHSAGAILVTTRSR